MDPFIEKKTKKKTFTDISTLPQELCPRRAELEDSANQALTLIKRWRRTGEVEFTVSIRAQQWEKREHTQCFDWRKARPWISKKCGRFNFSFPIFFIQCFLIKC